MMAEDILKSTPATIWKIEGDIIRHEEDLARQKMRARFMQADAFEVVSGLTVDGKKVFTNADAREAAARNRLAADPEWKALQDAIDAAETLKKRMEATIRYHQDVQRNARCLVLARAPSQLVFEEMHP